MRARTGLALGIVAVAAIGGAGLTWRAQGPVLGQPAAERRAQADLPHSHDMLWELLGSTPVSEDRVRGVFAVRFPAGVRALSGRTLTVSGYMLPLETDPETRHFLLSRNTPVCPFCPPGRPNEVIEVRSSGPVYPDTGEVTVTGRFGLQNDGSVGLFFRLDGADVSG